MTTHSYAIAKPPVVAVLEKSLGCIAIKNVAARQFVNGHTSIIYEPKKRADSFKFVNPVFDRKILVPGILRKTWCHQINLVLWYWPANHMRQHGENDFVGFRATESMVEVNLASEHAHSL